MHPMKRPCTQPVHGAFLHRYLEIVRPPLSIWKRKELRTTRDTCQVSHKIRRTRPLAVPASAAARLRSIYHDSGFHPLTLPCSYHGPIRRSPFLQAGRLACAHYTMFPLHMQNSRRYRALPRGGERPACGGRQRLCFISYPRAHSAFRYFHRLCGRSLSHRLPGL